MKKIFFFCSILTGFTSVLSQNLQWAHRIGGANIDDLRAMAVDNDGNVYTTGAFENTVDFDPGPGTFNLVSFAQSDIFIQKIDSAGNFIWAKKIGGNNYDYGMDIHSDNNGYIYITGVFGDTVDFNPGGGIANRISNGAADIFTLKMDDAGNYIWATTLGGIYSEEFPCITTDASGNVITAGYFQLTADFNPGAGIDTMHANTNNTFLQKLDNNGSFVWAASVRSVSAGNWPVDLTTDAVGNIYTTGVFQGPSTDFDPGIDSTQLTGNGYVDIYVLKLDAGGNFGWVKQMGGPDYDQPTSIAVDGSGNIYTSGNFKSTVDFDPGTSVLNFTSAGDEDAFLQKLDNAGNFIWAKTISGPFTQTIESIDLDSAGYIYTGGHYGGIADFDPGPGTYTLPPLGTYDVFLSKYNASGNLIWAKQMAGSGEEYTKGIAIDNTGNFYISGTMWATTDFDPGPSNYSLSSNGMSDFYIAKLSPDPCSNLTLVIDTLNEFNCITFNAQAFSHAEDGSPPYNYSWNTVPPVSDSAATFTTGGIYNLSVVDQKGCANASSVLINYPLYFSDFDLNANLVTDPYRPAFVSYVWIDAYNDACDTSSATLTLVLDTLVEVYAVNPPPNLIAGNSLIWNIPPSNFTSPHFTPLITLITDTTAIIGDSVHLQLIIAPVNGDVDSTNNLKTYTYPVINGYDPNDKKVDPPGQCDESYLLSHEKLTYTIRFQNTGNADAINIHLIDTLDPNLNLNTLRVIGTSHNVITEVFSGNILNFKFNTIHLPDSNTNEALSHGYLVFEVMPDSMINSGTVVKNTAYIYFDFNPPVVTNSTLNTLVDLIPTCNISGILEEDWTNTYLVYPNPVDEQITISSEIELKNATISISDINGKTLIEKPGIYGDQYSFNIAHLNSGLYFLCIRVAEKTSVFKIIKN